MLKQIFFFFISILFVLNVTARTYYIARPEDGGNDANPGTLASPWATWDHITGRVVAGDFVYIRGGTYFSPYDAAKEIHCYWNNLGGTATNFITIQNYPGEVPIFNCSNVGTPSNPYPYEVYINSSPYLYVKGLTITGLRQNQSLPGFTRGLGIVNSPNVTIEQVTVTRIGGSAFQVFENSNDVLFKNCDAFYNDDRYSTGGAGAFGGADGYDVTGGVNSTRITYDGCRAAYNSDDGWDCFATDSKRVWINCWGIANGYYKDSAGVVINAGDGNSFKLGRTATDKTDTDTLRILKNCLAVYNRENGFDQNGTPTTRYQLYNCTAYKNGNYGFQFQYYPVTPITQTFKNNIAYQNTAGAILYVGSNVNNTNNSWNAGYTVTNADFQSIDSSGVMGARQADGSLPYLPFMRLVNGSDLVNTGTPIPGISYCGSAPDLGCFELCTALTAVCGSNQTIQLPVTTSNLTVTASGGQSPYTYTWRQIPSTTTTITNTSVATTSVTNVNTVGTYSYEITVNDAVGATAKDTMTVTQTAAAATPPTCSAGTTPITITLPTTNFALNGTGASTAGNTVSYLWGFTLGTGTIASNTSQVTTATIAGAGNYTVSLLVTDNGNGLTCTSSKSVTVNPQPVTPTANAGVDQTITLPTNSTSLTGSGSGGTITGYQWTIIQGIGGVLSAPTSATTNLSSLSVGVYKIRLQVTNNFGNTGADTVQVTVNPAPVAPSCSAGLTPVTIVLPVNSAALTATGNSNSGNTVSFLWTKLTGTGGSITNANTANATATGLTAGIYTYRITVTDLGNNLTCTSDKTVNVNPALIIPTANAGTNQTITLPTNSVSLSGSGSGGTINTYLWTKISGLGGTFSAATSANTNFTALSAGIYLVQLRVGNTDGLFGYDTVQITVNPAIVLPTANAGTDKVIALPVNFAAMNGSGTGTNITYQWNKLSGSPATGSIQSPTQAVTQGINLVQGTYSMELVVTDINSNVAKDTMTITVQPQPNIPPVVNAGSDQTISLPTSSTTLTGTVIVSNGTLAGVTWTQVSGTSVTITSPSALTTTITGFTTAGVYKFRLFAMDSNSLTGADTVTITVQQTTTGNGIRYLQAYYYPDNSGRGDVGWSFDYAKYPRTLYMIGQIKLNGVYKDFGAQVIPTLKTKDYYTFFNIKSQPKGTYYFRIRQQDSNGVSYSNEVSIKKK